MFFFFFKQKTAYEMRISDWSSDVCSSDLYPVEAIKAMARVCCGAEKHPTSTKSGHRLGQQFERCDESAALAAMYTANHFPGVKAIIALTESGYRSEERRVGKECVST